MVIFDLFVKFWVPKHSLEFSRKLPLNKIESPLFSSISWLYTLESVSIRVLSNKSENALFQVSINIPLSIIIDKNNLQTYDTPEPVAGLNNLYLKLTSFGFETRMVDGHSISKITRILKKLPFKKINQMHLFVIQ